MGIRKHFEKKPPDENLKLQDLSLKQEETPELKFDPETEITESAWQGMKQKLENYRNSDWWDFAALAMSMKILSPDKSSELNIDDQAWQGMKQKLENYRNSNWRLFADQAMSMKILSPDKSSDLKIDNKAWQKMKQELEANRNSNWWEDFAIQARRMKIMAADKIKVTDQGLEITMRPPESFKSEKKPRPERRQF